MKKQVNNYVLNNKINLRTVSRRIEPRINEPRIIQIEQNQVPRPYTLFADKKKTWVMCCRKFWSWEIKFWVCLHSYHTSKTCIFLQKIVTKILLNKERSSGLYHNFKLGVGLHSYYQSKTRIFLQKRVTQILDFDVNLNIIIFCETRNQHYRDDTADPTKEGKESRIAYKIGVTQQANGASDWGRRRWKGQKVGENYTKMSRQDTDIKIRMNNYCLVRKGKVIQKEKENKIIVFSRF